MKGMLLCHTNKCAHCSFHVSVSSSRVSAFWQTFHFGSKQIQYDQRLRIAEKIFQLSSALFRWALLLQMQNYAQLRRLSVRAEWRAAGRSQSRIRHAFVACRKANQNCVNYLNMSPKILWKIPISTHFGSKATEEDEGRWGKYWSQVGCAFWSQLKWGFWQFSRSCFPLRLFFLESGLEKIMRLLWVFLLLLSPLPWDSLESQFNESLQNLSSLVPGFCLAGNFYCV